MLGTTVPHVVHRNVGKPRLGKVGSGVLKRFRRREPMSDQRQPSRGMQESCTGRIATVNPGAR